MAAQIHFGLRALAHFTLSTRAAFSSLPLKAADPFQFRMAEEEVQQRLLTQFMLFLICCWQNFSLLRFRC